jgi:hypothetical protein
VADDSPEETYNTKDVGCTSGFWHSPAKIVAGVCDPGPSRTAGLTEASYKDPSRQNPLAHPSLVIRFVTGQHGDAEGRTFSTYIGEPIAGSYRE